MTSAKFIDGAKKYGFPNAKCKTEYDLKLMTPVFLIEPGKNTKLSCVIIEFSIDFVMNINQINNYFDCTIVTMQI